MSADPFLAIAAAVQQLAAALSAANIRLTGIELAGRVDENRLLTLVKPEHRHLVTDPWTATETTIAGVSVRIAGDRG